MKLHAVGAGLALAFAALLSACSIEDEGATDYRRAAIKLVNGGDVSKPDLTGGKVDLVEKYTPEDFSGSRVKPGEFYAINLKQGVVRHFDDLPSVFNGNPFGVDGEVAIIANVFEIGDGDHTLAFGPASRQQAKVIYFSSDVERGQYLNLSQLPLYGPIEYKKGNSVVVQLTGVELDELDASTSAMLQRLADLGKGAAALYNPLAGEAAQVLTDIALAFLNKASDDIIFSYTFTLAPYRTSEFVNQDYLTEGTRVLARMRNRQTDFPWDQLTLNKDSGRLELNHPIAGHSKDFLDQTYFTIDVVRTDPGLSSIQQQALKDLTDEIKNAGSVDSKSLDTITKDTQSLLSLIGGTKQVNDKIATVADPHATDEGKKAAVYSMLTTIRSSLTAIAAGNTPAWPQSVIEASLGQLREHVKSGFDLKKLDADTIKNNATDLDALAKDVVANWT